MGVCDLFFIFHFALPISCTLPVRILDRAFTKLSGGKGVFFVHVYILGDNIGIGVISFDQYVDLVSL